MLFLKSNKCRAAATVSKVEHQFGKLLSHFYKFAKSYLGLNKDASINFVSDPINSTDVLGKTAHYDPNVFSITVYVDGRHPKDILRSIAHELVHHRQNCQGKMNQPSSTEPGYAQNDPHLRGLEREAYLVGNMCFRDWEDKYKANREVKTIYESTIRNFIKERINMKSNDELRNIVKEAVTKVLNKRTLKEFDRYGDEFASDEDDSYFADLAKEFPDMGLDDSPAGAEPEAPADIRADMEDEFGSKEEPEEDLEEMFGNQEDLYKYMQDSGKLADMYGPGKTLPKKKDDEEEEEKNEVSIHEGEPCPNGCNCNQKQEETVAEEINNIIANLGEEKVLELLRNIDEESKSTPEYDDAKELKGKQDELPDHLQKAIIDKADDKEEESTNEAEDFYTQLRKDARTISEDWNKDIRNKRSTLLNERLMKAWKFTK